MLFLGSTTFSVIIPTCGRDKLKSTLESIKNQDLVYGDEVLVVSDGYQKQSEDIFHEVGLPGKYLYTSPTQNWGNQQRSFGMIFAEANYITFMDDDDIFVPNAFNEMRKAIKGTTGLHIFRMRYGNTLIPEKEEIRLGKISTQCLCISNHFEKLGKWGFRRCGDYDFASSSAKLWGEKKTFFHNIITSYYHYKNESMEEIQRRVKQNKVKSPTILPRSPNQPMIVPDISSPSWNHRLQCWQKEIK